MGDERSRTWRAARLARSLRYAPLMPSIDHASLVHFFRESPRLVVELLQSVLDVPVPPDAVASLVDTAWSELPRPERHVDAAVLLEGGGERLIVLVEAQLQPDPDKRWRWPLYVAATQDRHKCPVYLIVIAPDEAVARWARKPYPFGHPGLRWAPLVIGPSVMPRIVDEARARAAPWLAVLSAMFHRNSPDIAVAAYAASRGLAERLVLLYNDLVLRTLEGAARRKWERLMNMKNYKYEYKSDFAVKYFTQGKTEGEAKGKAEGKAEDVLKILRAHQVPLTPEDEARIRSTTDLAVLDAWFDRALQASSVAELWS